MFVFIAHAEADRAAADELKAFLKRRGMVAETENGTHGFRYLQKTDVVIGLWSQNSVFDTHRMLLERRMLDAWADAQLVLVKLDHSVLPVGVRDLPAIDASFEQARDLNGWTHAERAVRTAMNESLVQRVNGSGPGAPPQSGPAPLAKPRRAPPSVPWQTTVKTSGGGSGGIVALALVTLLLGGVVGAAWYYNWQFPLIPAEFQTLAVIAAGVAHAGLPFAFISLLSQAFSAGENRRRAKAVASPTSRSTSAVRDELAAPLLEPEQDRPPATAVFVSYSHADNAAVEPVVKAARDNGREVWIDKSGIQAGDGWAGEIVRAIKSARGLMVMCSQHAFESDHVKRELYLADRYKKPMAPVFLEDARPPEDFEYFFAGVQWLELYKLPEADRPAAIGKALAAV